MDIQCTIAQTCDIDPLSLLLVDDPVARHPVSGDVSSNHYDSTVLEPHGNHVHVLMSANSHHLMNSRNNNNNKNNILGKEHKE